MLIGRRCGERQQAYQEHPSYQRDGIHGIPPYVLSRASVRLTPAINRHSLDDPGRTLTLYRDTL